MFEEEFKKHESGSQRFILELTLSGDDSAHDDTEESK